VSSDPLQSPLLPHVCRTHCMARAAAQMKPRPLAERAARSKPAQNRMIVVGAERTSPWRLVLCVLVKGVRGVLSLNCSMLRPPNTRPAPQVGPGKAGNTGRRTRLRIPRR